MNVWNLFHRQTDDEITWMNDSTRIGVSLKRDASRAMNDKRPSFTLLLLREITHRMRLELFEGVPGGREKFL